MHRADLHDALRAAVGDEHITLGACCVSVEEHGSEVAVRFADRPDVRGDLVVGADGIHSVVREYVAGPDQPTWWPQIAWRGLVPAAIGREVGLELRQHVFAGPHAMFVTYYVSAGRLVNWIAPTPSDGWREESWSARGDRDEALTFFDGWHPQVRALIAGTEQVFKWAMFDRASLETWTRGRVTLLGDAAHPMMPFMGQGAAQSIEDGFVLARCLAADRDHPERASACKPNAVGSVRLRCKLRRANRDAICRSATWTRSQPERADARNPGSAARPVRLGLGVRRREGDRRQVAAQRTSPRTRVVVEIYCERLPCAHTGR